MDKLENKIESGGVNRTITKVLEWSTSSDNDVYLNHIITHHTLSHNCNKKTRNTWILLNSQSTMDVFTNPQLLTNIRMADGEMTI